MLGLDFFHGIQLGQDRIAYLPTYRLRQSLAVAISRLHEPRPGGYLAYRSVVDVLSADGFALLDGDPGPRLNRADFNALLNDGPRLDRMIQQARGPRRSRSAAGAYSRQRAWSFGFHLCQLPAIRRQGFFAP
jgi:hypothetical protein